MEFVSPEQLRLDGRRPKELRQLKCELGVLRSADGSASFEMGNTKVLAVVYGPRETPSRQGGGAACVSMAAAALTLYHLHFAPPPIPCLQQVTNRTKQTPCETGQWCAVSMAWLMLPPVLFRPPRYRFPLTSHTYSHSQVANQADALSDRAVVANRADALPDKVTNRADALPDRAVVRCEYGMASFSTGERRRRGKMDRQPPPPSPPHHILSLTHSSLPFHSLPGTRSACINAATLALCHAGIPMRDLVTSCASGYLNATPLLDLNYVEDSGGGPDVTVGYLPSSDKISLLQMDAKLPMDTFEEVVKLAVTGCKAIAHRMRQVLLEHTERLALARGAMQL
ncbi:unnamed protein product [Closterium sp. Naga37s-1]|nr:unnamed protein product [Closterium sp. Naga37s-1]